MWALAGKYDPGKAGTSNIEDSTQRKLCAVGEGEVKETV